MEAEKIQALLSVSPTKLEKVAERIEIPLPLAREMRVQALNLMLGKCVLCETPTPMGLCTSCRRNTGGKPILRTTREKILRKLDPKAVLIRRPCATCGNEFTQTVDAIIRNLLNFGRPHIAKSCRKCRGKKRKMSALDQPKERRKRKPAGDGHIVNQPFAESEVLAQMRSNLQSQENPGNKAKK